MTRTDEGSSESRALAQGPVARYAEDKLHDISIELERAKIAEYVDLLNRPFSLIWRNMLGGIARGVGIAVGFTVFAATILYVLRVLGALNLPIVGDYIADIVRVVQHQLEGKTY